MSNSIAIALIAASSFPGFFCYIYTSRLANAVATDIVTGVVGGMPLPAEFRWRLLYQRWLYYVLPAVGAAVAASAINFKIARLAVDGGVQSVAYLVAFGFALAVVGWLLTGLSEFAYYRRVLKEATKD